MSVTTWRVLTKDCLFLFIFIEFYTSPIFTTRIFENSQFISPGEVANLSTAHSWCLNHSSRLVKITSEELWKQTEEFVRNFSLTSQYQYILNIVGEELPAWQWITGTNFTAVTQFNGLKHDHAERYAHLSRNSASEIIIEDSQPDYPKEACLFSYICEYETPANSKCNKTTAVSFEGRCYVFYEHENVSWFGAYHACKKNKGRLATFQTIPRNDSNFSRKLTTGRQYWIGLFRHKWSWDKSGDLLTFTNWDRAHIYNYGDSSVLVDRSTRKWRPAESRTVSSAFVCLKGGNTTKPTTNTAAETKLTTQPTKTTTSETTTTTTTTTIPLPTTIPETTTTIPPPTTTTTPKTTIRSRNPNTRTSKTLRLTTTRESSISTGVSTGTTISEKNANSESQESNPSGHGNEMWWIFVLAGGILLVAVAILVVFVCVMKRNKSTKPNDTKQSDPNKTSNTSALDYARVNYSELNGSDKNGNKESKKGTTSDHGNPIYGQVINRPDENRTEPAQSSLVYADLEFIQKNIKEDPKYSNQELKTQPPSLKTGPMGDVYAMVQK